MKENSSYIGRHGVHYLGDWTEPDRFNTVSGHGYVRGDTYSLYVLNLRVDPTGDLFFHCDIGAHYGEHESEYLSGSYSITKEGKTHYYGSEPLLHAIIRAMERGLIPTQEK